MLAFVLEGDHTKFVHWYIDDIWLYLPDSPPMPTSPVIPEDGGLAYNGTSLIWDEVPNATGYKVYFGTDNPPTNIENGTVFTGNVYEPADYLTDWATYYWKIIPYNSYGDAADCDVWTFSVKQLPPPYNLKGESVNSNVNLMWNDPFTPQDSILIADLDPNTSSGPIIESTLLEIGFDVKYINNIPQNIDSYTAIFVCLGIYNDNHQLSTDEGQKLADYLNNGGNLYLEGGDA